MKKTLLIATALLLCIGAQAQTKPAQKAPVKSTATARVPAAKPAPATAPVTPTPEPEPEPDTRPAPVLDENGWPVADPEEEKAKAAPAKGGAKKPAAKPKAGAAGKKGAPAKPVVYLPAEFFYSLDAKPVDKTKGLPEKAKGMLSITVKNANRVEKENPKGPVKVAVTLVERAKPNEPKTKEITLGQAKQGIQLQNFFGTPVKPGDQVQVALTNVKEPQTSTLLVEAPESAIFNIMIDGKKIDRKKGMPASSTGLLVIAPKGADKLKKVNANDPVVVGLVLMRDKKPVSTHTLSLEEAQGGLVFEGLIEDAKPGDQLIIDLKNTEEPHFASVPLQ